MSSLRLAMKLSLQETGVSSGTLKKPLQETGISSGGDGSGGGKKKKKERGPGRRRRHPRQSGRKLLKNAPINAERSQDHQHDQIDFEGKSKHEQYRQNKWKEMFKRLQGYRREHDGCCNVPVNYSQDLKLGRWVLQQRRKYKDGLLAKEQCDLLEAIGFEWSTRSIMRQKWPKMFARLQAYQREHNGSCNVPGQYHRDLRLAKWVSWQRYCYKKGSLAKERCDQLKAIGFEWLADGEESLQDSWTNMFERLQAHQKEHKGSCNLPGLYSKYPKLGKWVDNQRYRYKTGRLNQERIDQLEAIGFEWTCNRVQSLRDQWTSMLKRLQDYQNDHDGSCNVPHEHSRDPQLAKWVKTQRYMYRKGVLAKERRDQLEAIGFQWTVDGARASTQASKTKPPDGPEERRWGWV